MRSSERISGKIINRAALRPSYTPRIDEYVNKKVIPLYCRECNHCKRANDHSKDYCRKRKKTCYAARYKVNITPLRCGDFEPWVKPVLAADDIIPAVKEPADILFKS